MTTRPLALALFSGGLDSILAARLIMEQNIPVRCVHFTSPFFGHAGSVPQWEKAYGLSITAIDLSADFVRMLQQRPAHGFGKTLNPCVDCKILMMRAARALMAEWGASFVISGEVLGQRPMSQRRDTLNLIRREADMGDVLLRPLSAQHLKPTPMEEDGIVDRSRLLGFFGRGRKDQMQLAQHFELREIPTPAGGCRLTERENARRYWPLLSRIEADANDFHLANVGRQVWAQSDPEMHADGKEYGEKPLCWLSIGRHQADNALLLELARPEDVLLKVADMPGPLGLGRRGAAWSPAMLADAAAYVASFAPKAMAVAKDGGQVSVRVTANGQSTEISVRPERVTPAAWGEDAWDDVREGVRTVNRAVNDTLHA